MPEAVAVFDYLGRRQDDAAEAFDVVRRAAIIDHWLRDRDVVQGSRSAGLGLGSVGSPIGSRWGFACLKSGVEGVQVHGGHMRTWICSRMFPTSEGS